MFEGWSWTLVKSKGSHVALKTHEYLVSPAHSGSLAIWYFEHIWNMFSTWDCHTYLCSIVVGREECWLWWLLSWQQVGVYYRTNLEWNIWHYRNTYCKKNDVRIIIIIFFTYLFFFLGPFKKLCLGISVLWQTCFVKENICSWTC